MVVRAGLVDAAMVGSPSGLTIDHEAQDVGAGVVTYGIELATGLAGVVGVDLGIDDSVGAFERAGQDVALRTADRGVAPGQPVVVASVDLSSGSADS
jgi:hypothetical protein